MNKKLTIYEQNQIRAIWQDRWNQGGELGPQMQFDVITYFLEMNGYAIVKENDLKLENNLEKD